MLSWVGSHSSSSYCITIVGRNIDNMFRTTFL
nr:MAG TPA: hypothetical protein [Bacteriophage sp.]